MSNLETQISEWRRQMLAAGVKSPVLLEELESHLREEIGNLVARGKPEPEAFQIACARVGLPGVVGIEFKKTAARSSWPTLIGSLVWLTVAAALSAIFLSRWETGKLGLLLAVHIFTLTTGYVAALVAGGFGIYGVCSRRLGATSAEGEKTLDRAIRRSTEISASLTLVGLVTGMFWSLINRGFFWDHDPREIGGVCAAAWLVVLALVLGHARIGGRGLLRLVMVGNMIIGLAWFGAGALAHGENPASYWPLDLLLGIHLFFLGLSLTPDSQPVET